MATTSPISTALLSYGMSGKVFHAPLIAANPGFQLSTILQRSSDDAKLKYPHVHVVRSFEDVLKQNDIELVKHILNLHRVHWRRVNMWWWKNLSR
jgi:predicted dehydrogenase